MKLLSKIAFLLTLSPIVCSSQIKKVLISYPAVHTIIANEDSEKYRLLQVALIESARKDARIDTKFIEIDSTSQCLFLSKILNMKSNHSVKKVYFFKLMDSDYNFQVELFKVIFPQDKLDSYGKIVVPKNLIMSNQLDFYLDSLFTYSNKGDNSNIIHEQKWTCFHNDLKRRMITSKVPFQIYDVNFDPATDKYNTKDELKVAIKEVTNFIEKMEYLIKNNIKIDSAKFNLRNFISGKVDKSSLKQNHPATFFIYNYCHYLRDYILQKANKNFDFNKYSRNQLDYLNTMILQTDAKLDSKESRLWKSNSIIFNDARIALRRLTILNLEDCNYLRMSVDSLRRQKNFDLALDAFRRLSINCPFSNMNELLIELESEKDKYEKDELNKFYKLNEEITHKAFLYNEAIKTNQFFYQLGKLNDGIDFMFEYSEDSTRYDVKITIGKSNTVQDYQDISYYPPGEHSTKLSEKYFNIVSCMILKYSEMFNSKPGSNRFIINITGSSDAIPFNGKLRVKYKSARTEKFLDNTNLVSRKADEGTITSLSNLSASSNDNNLGLAFLRAYEFKHYLKTLNIDLNNFIKAEFHENHSGGSFRAVKIEITIYTN